jgi:hypothetical protein
MSKPAEIEIPKILLICLLRKAEKYGVIPDGLYSRMYSRELTRIFILIWFNAYILAPTTLPFTLNSAPGYLEFPAMQKVAFP